MFKYLSTFTTDNPDRYLKLNSLYASSILPSLQTMDTTEIRDASSTSTKLEPEYATAAQALSMSGIERPVMMIAQGTYVPSVMR